MSRKTIYDENIEAKNYHYKLGYDIYAMDADMEEYKYINNRAEVVARIDYKQGDCQDGVIDFKNHIALQAQLDVCNNQYKNPVPFFIVLTYLREDKKIWNGKPMFYVIPVGRVAKTFWKNKMADKYPLDEYQGCFLTPYEYSYFQHRLRDIPFDPEKSQEKDSPLKIKDLPNTPHWFIVPQIELNYDDR